jgi:Glycosyl transferase family 2
MFKKLYVGAIFKNEALGIVEWLEHYILFGVDHFYLINDGSTDDFREKLKPYADRITLYENDTPKLDGRQVRAYETFFKNLFGQDAWMMIVDLDEFIYTPHHSSIQRVLADYDQYSQITVDWIMFGSSGHKQQPPCIRTSFLETHSHIKPFSYKSIIKLNKVREIHVHYSVVSGDTLHLHLDMESYAAPLICNHYQNQSLERYEKIVMTRGDVNIQQYEPYNVFRNLDRFEKFDFKDKVDTRLADIVNNPVTLFLTSCNRPHLLKRTIESFVRYNTYPITQCIILEDSGKQGINDFVKDMCPFPVECVYNETNIGHIANIEKGYRMIKTKYIFHCEEDWEFYKGGFIEKSFQVLQADPKILTVWLRAHDDTNNHPFYPSESEQYSYMDSDSRRHPWYGYTTNPGLRRLSDYLLFAPWKDFCETPYYDGKNRLFEPDICILYKKHGYRAAILNDPSGHVRHIGWGETTNDFQHANATIPDTPSRTVGWSQRLGWNRAKQT